MNVWNCYHLKFVIWSVDCDVIIINHSYIAHILKFSSVWTCSRWLGNLFHNSAAASWYINVLQNVLYFKFAWNVNKSDQSTNITRLVFLCCYYWLSLTLLYDFTIPLPVNLIFSFNFNFYWKESTCSIDMLIFIKREFTSLVCFFY